MILKINPHPLAVPFSNPALPRQTRTMRAGIETRNGRNNNRPTNSKGAAMLKKFLTAAVVAAGFTGSVQVANAAYTAPATVQADADVDELMDEGLALMKTKNYDAAAKKFKAVLKVEPKHTEANYQLAWIYNEKEDYELAMKHAKAVIKVNAKDSDAWRELGFAQMKTEEFEDALESLEKSIGLNPKNLDAHVYIVAVHKSLGNTDEAADWQKKLDKLKKAAKPTKPTTTDDDEEVTPKPKKPTKPTTPDDDDEEPVKPMKKTTKPTKGD